MRIGFLLPAIHALDGETNGIRSQALGQAAGLRRLGHEVLPLEPWNVVDAAALDCVHFFQGGCAHFQIEHKRVHPLKMLSFAPQIDSNEPFWRYRLLAEFGRMVPKLFSVPRLYQDQCAASDVVIARSSYDRDRLVRGLGVDAAKIEIVLNGIDAPAAADPSLARKKFNLPAEFALHAGQYVTPNKNAVRMCEAIGPTGLPLVLVGPTAPGAVLDRLRALSEQYPNIMLLGFMDRAMLQSFFAGCKVLCLPSRHEGTGLVALEAAVHGAEVVVTRRGGPPDYFLEWGHYCDPFDVGSIRQAFLNAWNQPRRTALRDHVVNHLSWDKSAASLLRAFEKHRPVRDAEADRGVVSRAAAPAIGR